LLSIQREDVYQLKGDSPIKEMTTLLHFDIMAKDLSPACFKTIRILDVVTEFCRRMDIVTRLTNRIATLREQHEESIALVDALNEITLVILPADLERALRYQQEAFNLAHRLNYATGMGFASLTIGWMHFWHGKITLALHRGQEIVELGERLGDLRLNAYGGDLHAATLSAMGQAGDSLGYGMHILELFEQLGDERGIANATNMIALGFAELGDMTEAETRLRHALKLWQSYGDGYECALLFNNLVRICTRAHLYQDALKWAEQAASQCEAVEKEWNLTRPLPLWAYLHRNVAALYMDLGDMSQAEIYCRRSIAVNSADSERTLSLLCRQKGLLGRIFQAQGDTERAHEEFTTALVLAQQYHFVPPQIEGHHALYGLYKSQGNHAAALHHFEQCRTLERGMYSHHQTDRNRARDALREAVTARQQADMLHERTRQLESLVVELRTLQHQLREMSVRDSLTGLYNRRYLDEQLPVMWRQSRSHGEELAILLVDIDNFKQINDTFRHQLGDYVLIRLAEIFQSLRHHDEFVVRYGGEEFVLVLPAIHPTQVRLRAEQLRAAVERYPWYTLNPALQVTISIGVATAAPLPDHYALLRTADEHLYRAKRGGKNRVAMAG
jgi:diguanylate cyclase (GGDEF)-like protein